MALAFIIVFIIVSVFCLVAALNLRHACIFFIPLYFLAPHYLVFEISNIYLNLPRILIIVLFVFWVFRKLLEPRARVLKYYRNPYVNQFAIGLSVLFLLKICISLISPTGSVGAAISDFFLNAILLLILIDVLKSQKNSEQVVLVLVLTVFVVQIVSIIELLYGSNIFYNLITVTEEYQEKYLSGNFRHGVYRLQSTFTNPLVLAEFLNMVFPFTILLFNYSFSRNTKILCLFSILLTPLIIFFTYSRFGIFLIILNITYLILRRYYGRVSTLGRVNFKVFIIFSILLIFGFLIVADKNILEIFHSYGDVGTVASTYERIDQYSRGAELIADNPLYGYGVQRKADALEGMGRIDNYFLRTTLESGLMGLSIVLVLCYVVWKMLSFTIESDRRPAHIHYMFVISNSLFIYFLYKFVVSIPTNNFLMYICIALIANNYNQYETTRHLNENTACA